MKVVVIGGGFGGLNTVHALRGAPVEITLVDRSNHHLFQPLLYQVATAGLSPANIAAPIRAIFRKQQNVEVLMAEVTGIDPVRRIVRAGKLELDYDHLVIATGASHGYFGHDEWARFAPGLKSINDATRIRRKILSAFESAEAESDAAQRQRLMTFVLVGAGPTGVEMAGAIAELSHRALRRDFRHIDPSQARIVLLEAGDRILKAFPEDLAAKARAELERLGVEVRTGARVTRIDDQGVAMGSDQIASATVMWAAGVVASPVARWLGVKSDHAGRVLVDGNLSVPEYPEISVIGDVAHCEQDGAMLPGVAPVAMQQGRYLGKRLAEMAGGKGPSSDEPFRYFDKGNLATVGRAFAIADLPGLGLVRHLRLSGFIAWCLWLVVHVLYLIGFRRKIQVLIEWAWAYFSFRRGARLIVPEEAPEEAARDQATSGSPGGRIPGSGMMSG